MYLKTLSLRQFRNYDSLDVVPSPGLNLLVGANGAGKSNFLEAVSVLATGDSHRSAEGKNMFLHDKDELALTGAFNGEEGILLDARQRRGRPRQVNLNNAFQKRFRDWVGRVPVVSFSPEDMNLVKGEPGVRRKALNDILVQDVGDYGDGLQRYNKILEERNAALKAVQEGRAVSGSLEPWDLSFLKEGAALSMARETFIQTFTPMVGDRHRSFCAAEEVRLAYKPSLYVPPPTYTDDKGRIAEVVAGNRRRLQDLRDGEIATGTSLIGPHRDEMEIFLNEHPARAFSSQGQQRTLAIAFKFAEREFLKAKLNREPICLLDDMFSELDPVRRGNLAPLFSDGAQCFITLTTLEDWPLPDLFSAAAVFEVGGGRVTPVEARV